MHVLTHKDAHAYVLSQTDAHAYVRGVHTVPADHVQFDLLLV